MSPEVRDLLRYKSALQWWYARMFAAARNGEHFDEPQPLPQGKATNHPEPQERSTTSACTSRS